MKNFISLLIFILFAWLGIWWYYSCNWCIKDTGKSTTVNKQKNAEAEAIAKKAYEDSIAAANKAIGLFAKGSDGQDIFTYPENLQINNTNGNVFIPSNLGGFIDQVAFYLGEHQDQELVITGLENSIENKNESGLGISRATYIKNVLVKAGINQDRIVVKTKSEDYTYNNDGIYNGGILLNFGTLDESRLAVVEKSVANRTLYSGFGQKTFKPDATLVNYALELKNYLNKYPNKNIQIIGHTDNVGSNEANLWYGQERANNVKKYLIAQGVEENKIKASSKGESDPIAPNDSDENKAKNRRIEIIVN
ncbi:hypothetical protein AWE51_01815 [Aquimarina aggregata]|uniref:OmpA-like domain-containing protein n=1 Tax=Aquimarina aggregata TaxID=1642818 RepID=A0A163CA07_9FLAO|nr:OmpA family protein [Aquimarina aggregata]KZS42205.1 hypothetical protein AWE51_01815 [Aquimarina aggregata]